MTDTTRPPATATTPDGAPGVVNGVTDDELDAEPAPTSFTARNRTEYRRPFDKPSISIGLSTEAGERSTHVEPPSNEYS